MLLRILRDVGAIPPRLVRYLSAELDTIGRMLGGWRKALAKTDRRPIESAGPTGSDRVQRGGSWNDDPDKARSAYRNHRRPNRANDDDGFRVAVAAPPPSSRVTPPGEATQHDAPEQAGARP